ncbi:MAG: hypothetical protein ACJ8BW_11710 [Ktedonobacteraceae bacterium]|jgi:hypothetical protein
MSTVHCVFDKGDLIKRYRKAPKPTSTNAKVVLAVFGGEYRKWLYIPIAIDDYNHHMNGVDIANQRRKYCSTYRKRNLRSWRPLFHWLLDVTVVNSYILWREQVSGPFDVSLKEFLSLPGALPDRMAG